MYDSANLSYKLQLQRVPGHVGIEGNEKADQAAKEAATDLQEGSWQTNLKSARSNAIYQAIKQQWQKEWENDRETARSLRHMTKSSNTKPPSHIYDKLGNKRKHIAWIAQLRTGHCSLNQYLARFKIVDDATCPECNETTETVKHFLLVCPKYERARDRMRRKVGFGGMRVDKLLGDARRIEATVEFIKVSGRLNF
jgi:hypothetical protein